MLNLQDNIIISISIVTAFILITGIAVACTGGSTEERTENLSATWEVDRIEARAWNFTDPEKCYQIRYYQPNTLPDEDELISLGKELEDYIWDQESPNSSLTEPYNASNPSGFYVVNPKFPGNNSLYNITNPYVENLTSPGNGWVAGEWIVVLLKSGDVVDCSKHPNHDCCKDCCCECCNDPHLLANSYRVHCRVYVPIPEFSTIALPIASILGIMFILQNRRRKED